MNDKRAPTKQSTRPHDPDEPEESRSVLFVAGVIARSFDGVVTKAASPLGVAIVRAGSALIVTTGTTWAGQRESLRAFDDEARSTLRVEQTTWIVVGAAESLSESDLIESRVAATLPPRATEAEIRLAAARAFELLAARRTLGESDRLLARFRYEQAELANIARAMSTERDVDKLLGLILEKSRYVTGSDAGSIYVVEGEEHARVLRFKLTQNDSKSFDSREFVMPLSSRSMAGSAALERRVINIEDVYQIAEAASFHFDPSFDIKIGYRTRSMLTVPLISQRDEVIGVIQLINKKRQPKRRLLAREDFEREVIPFDARSEELARMIAAQASASLETATLYDDIRRLFDGFVRASVEAIESRDPTTSGHSRRVANLTVELARVVHANSTGPYAEASFSAEDLREIEYASLLHDFGKIGVREKVLVKAKKLYDEELDRIRDRFDFVARTIEADFLAQKLRAIEEQRPRHEIESLDEAIRARRAELESTFSAVLAANEPTVMVSGDFARIRSIADAEFVDLRGERRHLLTEEEVASLSVRRGSLTTEEIEEIRSHVTHTYRFLSRIPWGKSFRRVPAIAAAHHERLNGDGYPHGLKAHEIPLPAKLMAISDIYDALTASDRPYKKAIGTERALDILEHNVRDGHLDGELVSIFREAEVWERVRKG